MSMHIFVRCTNRGRRFREPIEGGWIVIDIQPVGIIEYRASLLVNQRVLFLWGKT